MIYPCFAVNVHYVSEKGVLWYVQQVLKHCKRNITGVKIKLLKHYRDITSHMGLASERRMVILFIQCLAWHNLICTIAVI